MGHTCPFLAPKKPLKYICFNRWWLFHIVTRLPLSWDAIYVRFKCYYLMFFNLTECIAFRCFSIYWSVQATATRCQILKEVIFWVLQSSSILIDFRRSYESFLCNHHLYLEYYPHPFCTYCLWRHVFMCFRIVIISVIDDTLEFRPLNNFVDALWSWGYSSLLNWMTPLLKPINFLQKHSWLIFSWGVSTSW